jgi:ribonuclease HI
MSSSVEIVAFCDASYSPETKKGIYGYFIRGYDSILFETVDINNTQLEILAAIKAIDTAKLLISINTQKIILYTDCDRVVSLYGKFRTETLTDREKQLYKNLLKSFESIASDLNPPDLGGFRSEGFASLAPEEFLKVIHIKGHKKQSLKNDLDKEFSIIDILTRERSITFLEIFKLK